MRKTLKSHIELLSEYARRYRQDEDVYIMMIIIVNIFDNEWLLVRI